MDMLAAWFVVMVFTRMSRQPNVHSKPMWFIACQLNLNKGAKDYDAHELSGPTAPALSPELLTWVLHQWEVSNEWTSPCFCQSLCSSSWKETLLTVRDPCSCLWHFPYGPGFISGLSAQTALESPSEPGTQTQLQPQACTQHVHWGLVSSQRTVPLPQPKVRFPALSMDRICAKLVPKCRHEHSCICPHKSPPFLSSSLGSGSV